MGTFVSGRFDFVELFVLRRALGHFYYGTYNLEILSSLGSGFETWGNRWFVLGGNDWGTCLLDSVWQSMNKNTSRLWYPIYTCIYSSCRICHGCHRNVSWLICFCLYLLAHQRACHKNPRGAASVKGSSAFVKTTMQGSTPLKQ